MVEEYGSSKNWRKMMKNLKRERQEKYMDLYVEAGSLSRTF